MRSENIRRSKPSNMLMANTRSPCFYHPATSSLLIRLFLVDFFQDAVRLLEDDLKFFEQLHLLFRVFRIAHLFRDSEKFILEFGEFLVRHERNYEPNTAWR